MTKSASELRRRALPSNKQTRIRSCSPARRNSRVLSRDLTPVLFCLIRSRDLFYREVSHKSPHYCTKTKVFKSEQTPLFAVISINILRCHVA